MVLRICETLDIPLRNRNELLTAAGFAPVYADGSLMRAELERARDALDRILLHHEPYPAMIVDSAWNILMKNAASTRMINACVDEAELRKLSPDGSLNFMRMMFSPNGLRPFVRSWDVTATYLIGRLRREINSTSGSASETLLQELLPQAPPPFVPTLEDMPLSPTAPLELDVNGQTLRLFNAITTFGAPQDVLLQGLRIEMSFPMDDGSDAYLRALAASS
jgi:hypothetical protein